MLSAATLSGLQFNVSGIIGPALGGLLVALAGANFVFALNGACFFLVVLAIRQWKQPPAPADIPSESFFESFGAVTRHVRRAPGFQIVLARNFLFALFISVIPALMPVVALKELNLSSANLGLLFTSMGALGGVIWGSTAAIAGADYTLLGAAALFFTSLLLGRRLSINVPGNLEETVSGFTPGSVEEAAPIGFTKELLPA
jgi:Transmembrane secretion effector